MCTFRFYIVLWVPIGSTYTRTHELETNFIKFVLRKMLFKSLGTWPAFSRASRDLFYGALSEDIDLRARLSLILLRPW